MNKGFLSVTVFVTSLILTPVMASPFNINIKIQKNSISTNIATILHKRGLDEDAAQKIAKSFIGEDEELFTIMLRNLENGCSTLSKNEILEYLSHSALQKRAVDFTSYSSLIGMVQKIKKQAVEPYTMKELEKIANKNSLYLNKLVA